VIVISTASPGTRTVIRPIIAELINQGESTRAISPIKQPAEFAFSDPTKFPFIKYDQLVVIPQEGHRMPVNWTIVHGGSPNC